MTPAGRAVALIVGGVVLLQIAWIWSLAPFSSMDEVDHAFRAASVGHGHLLDRKPVSDGRGDLIQVPLDIVKAAHHRCTGLRYVGRDNCFPVGDPNSSGDVWIASAAARYDPAYYLLAGGAARPFHGVAALYVMRGTTAALSDAFLALALWVAFRRRRDPWPALAIVVGATPVMLCATATAAPNGVGMCAALAFWSAAAAILSADRRSAPDSATLWVAAASLSAVMLSHTTGIVWAAIGGVGWCIALRRERLTACWRQRRTASLGSLAVVAASAAFSVGWTISQRTNDPSIGRSYNGPIPWNTLMAQPFVWALQTIGAAPFRDQPGPSIVFVLGVALFAFIVTIGLRRAPRAVRHLALGLAAVALAFPLAATVLTYDELGFAWQGRYELPLGYGILVLAAWWVGGPSIARFRAVWPALFVAAATVMQATTVLHVRTSTIHWSAADGGSPPSNAVLVLLCSLAAVVALAGLHSGAVGPTRRTRVLAISREAA